MATQLFLAVPSGPDSTPPGSLSTDNDHLLRLTRDAGSATQSANTVNGPTAGVQIGATPRSWWTNPLAAVTISGTMTMNLWMFENNMSANVGAQVLVERCDGAGTFISTILNSERGTELVVTTSTAENWTASPTSTTLANGDRIRLRVYGNDVGTMATGFTFTLTAGAASAGIDGDSYIQFTETITEFVNVSGVAPHPQFIYLRKNR